MLAAVWRNKNSSHLQLFTFGGSMNIQGLQNFATQMETIGRNYVGMNEAMQVAQQTSSLGGRISVRHHANDAGSIHLNKLAAQTISNMLKSTDGITEGQKGLVDNLLHKALESGKPIRGREVAQMVREFVSIKTSEDKFAMEMRKLNAKGLGEQMLQGNPSKFDEVLNERIEHFGLSHEDFSAEDVAKMKQDFANRLQTKAAQSPNSLTLEGGMEVARDAMLVPVNMEFKNKINAAAALVSAHGTAADALPTAMAAKAAERGITTPIRPDQMASLAKKIEVKLEDSCYNPVQMPTPALARSVQETIINKFLDSMEDVDNSALPENQKDFLKKAISDSGTLFTRGMVQGVCHGIPAATNFLTAMQNPALANNRELTKQTGDAYLAAIRNACSRNFLVPGQGADETASMRSVIGNVALANKGVSSFDGHTPSGIARGMHDTLIRSGSPLSTYIHDTYANLNEDEKYLFNHEITSSIGQMTMRLQEDIDPNESAPTLDRFQTLGACTYAQAKERVPADFNPQGIDKAAFTAAVGQDFITSLVDNPNSYTPFQNSAAADDQMTAAEKTEMSAFVNQLGDQFMKDFERIGMVIDGERCGGNGCGHDLKKLHTEVSKLLAHFPNVETARQVCSPFHQGTVAVLFNQLMAMPESKDAMMQDMMTRKITESFTFFVNTNEDGTYTAQLDLGSEKVGLQDESQTFGSNMFVQFSVTPQEGQMAAQWNATSADAFFTTATV